MTATVMIDLEGTLSDHSRRLATLRAETLSNTHDRDAWKKYYKGLPDDEPRHPIMIMLREWIREGMRPIIYSTRFVNKYNHEEEWLRGHELWEDIDFVQRQPHQTKIKGPDLVASWVRSFEPSVLIDDREEVREACRGLIPGLVIYNPEVFTENSP